MVASVERGGGGGGGIGAGVAGANGVMSYERPE